MRIETPPVLKGKTDERSWNALSRWLDILHSQISGAFAHRWRNSTKITTATLTTDEFGVVFVDSSAGAFTITLPPVAKCGSGGWYEFIKTDSSSNVVTLDGSGAETINGAATDAILLGDQYDFCKLITNGTTWYIASRRGLE